MTDPITRLNTALEGRYRIERQLGEGGMATVYLARQFEPVRRRVAIKTLASPADSDQVLARFEVERQALALMDHPGIAKIFDAGAIPNGQPYFVMEWVQGERIDAFCDRHRLDVRERVRLVIDVCRAVQHAHQKGIVHRDLKPSNLLVEEGDEAPRPRIIDFGIVKAIAPEAFEGARLTRDDQIVGTPAYMSPEQIQGRDVDTRTDVYALGAVLYELLVGALPFDPRAYAGWLAVAAHLHRDPPTPAQRLAQLSHTQETVAGLRRTTPQALRRVLGGDLQWIVRKAMEKDRTLRYDTVDGLGADLLRFLSNEPTVAHPPSRRYRISKFARRNRTAIAVTAVVGVALSTAGAVALTSRGAARRSAEEVRVEAARAGAVNDFLVDVFGSADPRQDGRELKVVDFLGRASEMASQSFGGAPAAEGALRLALGTTYKGLGLYPEAEQEMRATLALYRASGDRGLPQVLHELGRLLVAQGRSDEAAPLQEEGLTLRRRQAGTRAPLVAVDLNAIAERLILQGDLDPAIAALSEALSIQEDSLDADAEDLSNTRSNLAVGLYSLGRVEEALPLFREALESQKRRLGPDHIDVATGSGNLAIVLQRMGRYDEAEPLLRDALRIDRTAYGNRHDNTARAANNLGLLYQRIGQLNEAEPLLREALAINTALFGEEHREVASNLHNLGLVVRGLGRVDEAVGLFERALAINLRVRPRDHTVPLTRTSLAAAYVTLGQLEEGEAQFRIAREEQVAIRGPDHPDVANLDSFLGECLRRMGRTDEAESLLLGALTSLRRQDEPPRTYLVNTYERLAALYEDLGDAAKAAEYHALAEKTP
jgi:tetratricopeptide (TPR) repeat protein